MMRNQKGVSLHALVALLLTLMAGNNPVLAQNLRRFRGDGIMMARIPARA